MKARSSFLFRCPEYFRSTLLTLFWFYAGTNCLFAAGIAGISDSVLMQIQTLQNEKASRSPAEQKLDSQLVFAAKRGRDRAFANAVPSLRPDVKNEPDGRVLVDIDGTVTVALLKQIEQRGGKVINSFARFKAIRALLPLDQIEVVSGSPDVKFVRPAVQADTNTGSVDSQGDTTHSAITARSTFNVDGTGVKVGVLSDSVDYLANSQANGDLGPVTVLSGQSGVPATGEGTALLEIIHDLAPGAQLFYATGLYGVANLAQNILDLRAAGCDIIVDDVLYFNESPFQDGPIAQAVNTVTAAGALYFSSAANSGNKNDDYSGTWEGDFLDAGAAPAPVSGKGGQIHSFGVSTQNTIRWPGRGVVLFWSDPLGGSANDYDLYILDSAGTQVVMSSANVQNGSQDPYEQVGRPSAGQTVVIVKAAGTARYLHLDTIRGGLSISTTGSTRGHSAAVGAFSVAAERALNSYPDPFVGGAQNPIEPFSSDGPRRVFYQADGTAITPGNFSSTGGTVRQKPDIAAADGVSTSVPGFGWFSGTSASAPHAAAIAALLLSYNSALTTAQVRSLLTSTALDIEAPGVDRDSGWGIVMALPALQAAPAPAANLVFSSSAITGGNGNNRVDPNECNQLVVTIGNAIGSSGALATGVSAILSTATPGVTITQPSSAYPNVPAGGTAANVTPFQISTRAGFICGTVVDLVLTVTTANGGNFTIPFQLSSGTDSPIVFNSTDVPKPIPDLSTVDSLLTVSGVTAAVARVTVTLYLTHPYDADLNISLVGPDTTTTVLLSSSNGASGDNYGTSCSARTIFDDSAATLISASSAPFAGTFRPQQALAIFNGKTGSAVNGTWRLRVSDSTAADLGTIQCWSINISPSTCPDGGGPCGNNPPTLILLEAESGTLTSPMTVSPDPLAFAGEDVSSPVGGAGSVSYTVNVPAAGQYVIWCRVLATSSAHDSFFVSMDGGAEDVYDAAEDTWSSLWQWSRVNGRAGGAPLTLNPRIFTLSAGAHVLLFRARDPDTRLDRLIVTDDLNLVPANLPPSISSFNDRAIVENTPTAALGFVVNDAETAASALIVTASSSNTTLVPNSNISLGGSGANRNITIIPATNQFGVTTIGLTVSDPDGGMSSASFVLTVLADSDGDGLPDTFEIANGLDKNDPTDAAMDLDGDGFSDLQEFLLGTNPRSAASSFEIKDTKQNGIDVQISLNSVAGKNYQFESSDISPAGPWNTIAVAVGNGGTLQVTDVGGAAQTKRFYRVQIMP